MIDLKTCDSGTTWNTVETCPHPESAAWHCKDPECGCVMCGWCGEWIEVPGSAETKEEHRGPRVYTN